MSRRRRHWMVSESRSHTHLWVLSLPWERCWWRIGAICGITRGWFPVFWSLIGVQYWVQKAECLPQYSGSGCNRTSGDQKFLMSWLQQFPISICKPLPHGPWLQFMEKGGWKFYIWHSQKCFISSKFPEWISRIKHLRVRSLVFTFWDF